jgi:hypothetical protein
VSNTRDNPSSTSQEADHWHYQVYVNSYLGSLNTREFIRFERARSEGDSRHGISLSARAPATNVHVERTTLRTIDNTSLHKGGRGSNDHAAVGIDVYSQFDQPSFVDLRDDAKPGDLESQAALNN